MSIGNAESAAISGTTPERDDHKLGFGARAAAFRDLLRASIADPAKAVRSVDAASVAGQLVTTEAMVAGRPEKKAPPMPAGGGRGGMSDMDF